VKKPHGKRWPIQHALKIKDLTLNVTYSCDLACVGCNRGCFIKPPFAPAMTLERLAQVYAEVKALGVQLHRTRICGGEPTLHPDFQAIVDMAVANSRHVRLYSNQHSDRARRNVAAVQGRHAGVRIMGRIAVKKRGSRVFRPETRTIFIDPTDAGVYCPWPCKSMFGRVCGMGVDQLGYTLCPTGGAIDSLLGLGARATSLSQMLDMGFVEWQAQTLCRHCGVVVPLCRPPQTWSHNGTEMSASFHAALSPK
jgi:hypothetical protein